ncbi:MAG TPA: MerR family transcriptional regulator, partial [Epulopiscium sp.]|nr:MerR family transcriptional regulator [Candidatus Epulonipiscium sp.]
MDVKSCKRCGVLFHHVVGPPLCQKCKKKDEEDFQRVKEYLYENPG